MAAGSGEEAVDLIRDRNLRLPLGGDEAAVAMLLFRPVSSADELLALAYRRGIKWTVEQLHTFIEKLNAVGLIVRADLPPRPEPEDWENHDTVVQARQSLGPPPRFDTLPGMAPLPPQSPLAGAGLPSSRHSSRQSPLPVPSRPPPSHHGPPIKSSEPVLTPLVLATRMMAKGQHEEARLIIEAVLSAEPSNPDARAMLGMLSSPAGGSRSWPRGLLIGSIVVLLSLSAACLIKVFWF